MDYAFPRVNRSNQTANTFLRIFILYNIRSNKFNNSFGKKCHRIMLFICKVTYLL